MSPDIYSTKSERTGKIELPQQFLEPLRTDIIQRAAETLWSHKRQPYSPDPLAGKKQVSWLSKRRRDIKSSYGKGQSRVPRKTMSVRGSQYQMVGAFAPGAVGGRKAHPPKNDKNWEKKLNVKERRKAIRSAISATINKELVKNRGHKIPEIYPIVLDDDFESIKTTAELKNALLALGFGQEIERASQKRIRAGKGKMRGRKHKTPKSIAIITGNKCALTMAGRNMPGMDIVDVNHLNVEILAPGTHPGRATLFTKNAVTTLKDKRLFL